MTSIDLTDAIKPKSDQLNADDLIAGDMTVTITSVTKRAGEQPIAYHFEGDNGKPYYPCKSMMRVLVHCWGKFAENHIGRSMTLYRDAKVTWAGAEVGGIRISHLSHIDGPMKMSLTAAKNSKKPYTVQPLGEIASKKSAASAEDKANAAKAKADSIIAEIKGAPKLAAAIIDRESAVISRLRNGYPALAKMIDEAMPKTDDEELPL